MRNAGWLVMVGVGWATPLGAAWACEKAVPVADVDRAIEAAESLVGRDPTQFKDAVTQGEAVLNCVDAPITPALAARMHRLKGLLAISEGRAGDSNRAFFAAKTIEPNARLFPDVFPDGHQIQDNYAALTPPRGASGPELNPDGQLYFDGVAASVRPESWPTIYQFADGTGALAETRYLRVDEPLPSFPTQKTFSVHRPLMYSGLAMLVVSGASYGVARSNYATWETESAAGITEKRHDKLKAVTNGSMVTSAVTLGLGVSFGAASVWVGGK